LVSLAAEGQFIQPQPLPLRVGMLIGQVYRLRVMNIPLNLGAEVFPTIEVIDRLYTPQDQSRRFPIPIELTREDLVLALEGKFVTRVIYLEDPRNALPVREDPQTQHWFEVGPGRDPLAEADALGRPVAILRLGARVPEQNGQFDANFLYGCPPFVLFAREVRPAARPKVQPEAREDVKVLPPPPEKTARLNTTSLGSQKKGTGSVAQVVSAQSANVAATVPVPFFRQKRGQAPSPQPVFADSGVIEATEPVPVFATAAP
jgi:hypothetical protein